ncbi:MAG: branched-chain amino acid ABC transporter permease, partial [Clostridiales bacterium]|nr:branched-chain amino acid ABC transporter permease [Clostridiales bacterium]
HIINSSFGRDLQAIRDDEIAAEAMGINNYWNKVVVFACAAFIAGLAGSVYAHCMKFIDPTSFKTDASFLVLSMVVPAATSACELSSVVLFAAFA